MHVSLRSSRRTRLFLRSHLGRKHGLVGVLWVVMLIGAFGRLIHPTLAQPDDAPAATAPVYVVAITGTIDLGLAP